MAKRRTIHIGLVFSYSFTFYRGIMRGIRRYIEARPDWLFTVFLPGEQSLQMQSADRPDGLIMSMDTPYVVQALSSWRRSAVDVSAVFADVPFSRIRVDNQEVGRLAAEHFCNRGIQYFAFVGPKDQLYSDERRKGFVDAVHAAGFTSSCYQFSLNGSSGLLSHGWNLEPAFLEWLHALSKPVGILVPFDFWGVQLAESCRRASIRVPEDVALLGVDNDDAFCELARPPLSSITLPTEQIGYEAAALLERIMLSRKSTRETILLPPTGVVARGSTETLAIDDPEVVSAVRYIRENVHRAIDVEDVLRTVPLGRRTLERRCRTGPARTLHKIEKIGRIDCWSINTAKIQGKWMLGSAGRYRTPRISCQELSR